jgi:uncharacterized protein YaaN involved in tellurite resistance
MSDHPSASPTATSTDTALALVAPPPVVALAAPEAQSAVKLAPAVVAKLDNLVATYLEGLWSLDPQSSAFGAKINGLTKLGQEDIRSSAQVSSRLLDRPLAAMTAGGLSANSAVVRSLLDLRRQVEALDPGRAGDLFSSGRRFGLLPRRNNLARYFARYERVQGHLNAIIDALYRSQDALARDNAALDQEKANLWVAMDHLHQYIYLGQQFDAALSARIAQVEATDPSRAQVLKEDALFAVRRKVQDLLTQLAVSVQGYLALELIRRNNAELIKGVDRATTTTVSALRTAVIVAQALSSQKLVLNQISALNAASSNLIESSSARLRRQSGEVNEQAASATIDLARLQAAFEAIYATMDEIDTFKGKALDNLSQTVGALNTQLEAAKVHRDRASSDS